jgi:predicted porin
MNKKVIALAVAGALALPLAAKAQTANVTMYGSFRLAFESVDLESIGRANKIDSWSSRWGIRGLESLGGGLNGLFHLETGVNLDTPGNATFESTAPGTNASNRYQFITIREAWAGLNGGFGTVKMGAGLTPYDDIFGLDHLLLANGVENMNNLGGGVNPVINSGNQFAAYGSLVGGSASTVNPALVGNACNNSTAFDARYGSGIRYDSPSFSGLQFATHFAFLGENATGFKCKGWDSKVQYMNGPIEAGLTYARHIDFQQYDGNAWRAHAGYDFGVAKVLGAYERIHLDGNNGSSGEATTRYYVVGAVIPIGAGNLNLQYGNRNKGATTSATSVTEVQNGGGKQYTASYWYFLSKRTSVYTWAARIKADSGATVIDGRAPLGGKVTAVGFGTRVDF